MEDKSANQGFSIVVDRSLGGASLDSGSLELMVHRRTQVSPVIIVLVVGLRFLVYGLALTYSL
jgi:hypothetical protein